MSKKKEKTVVISFRTSEENAKRIDRQAKRAKQKRAAFVAAVFTPAFEAQAQSV